MTDGFRKLMREQVQERIDRFAVLVQGPIPAKGWIRTIREALGMSSYVLAKRLGSSRANVTKIERREREGGLTLEKLEEVARALHCKLVYCLVPERPLQEIVEKQARSVARKRIAAVNHSMKLEEQGLTDKQLKQQEDDLVEELLRSNPRLLWSDDEF